MKTRSGVTGRHDNRSHSTKWISWRWKRQDALCPSILQYWQHQFPRLAGACLYRIAHNLSIEQECQAWTVIFDLESLKR